MANEKSNGDDQAALRGGIDLGTPVMRQIRDFQSQMVQRQGFACVLIGLDPSGNVTMTSHTPGGPVQFLGLLELAKQMVAPPEVQRR